LQAAAKFSPLAREELSGPPCPAAAEYLWAIYLELEGTRTSNGYGPNALAWSEIDAYARLRGFRFTPWELDALRALDLAARTAHAEGRK
jgi:hypothetical protein